ncbi:MAG: alpha/beta hydrolase family protein [Pirellula sp.]
MIQHLIQLSFAPFKLVARFKFSNKSLALGAWVIGSLLGSLSNEALAQVALDSAQQGTASERWVGWLETKSQNLRLIVSLSSSATGAPTGSVTSPDQSETSVPISNASIDDQRQLSFQVAPEGIGSAAYAFEGSFQGDKLSGILEQSGSKLPIQFVKASSLQAEDSQRLGADSVWSGSLEAGSRKVPLRFRFYDSAPFASQDKPRLLFDSLLEKANGFPMSVSINEKGLYEFSIPAIPGNAKYIAELSDDGNLLTGKFQQGFLPIQLDMQRIDVEPIDSIGDVPTSQQAIPKVPSQDHLSTFLLTLANNNNLRETPEAKTSLDEKEIAKAPLPMDKEPLAQRTPSAEGLLEEPFVVERFDSRKPLLNELGKRADNRFELAGTITFPKGFDPNAQYPAVVLITGSGQQDRDETIGRHKPFKEIANHLASQGMVVLRYDDRGAAESTGDFAQATSLDFAEDALAVWQFARKIEGVDRTRVGLLGHSEGGIIGPTIAAWQREVGFLILIAPPILPGTEILSSQIDRIAELQGVGPEDRAAANSLQRELQQIALKYPANDEAALSDVRKAIVERWESLGQLSQAVAGTGETTRKKQLIEAISTQFKGLQSPWMRHFLAYDPAANWVLFDCPVLAIWGEKDTQVLFEANRTKLQDIITHNLNLQADLVVLPGLNHLLQKADTGLPDEYDRIDQAIEPLALELFSNWLKLSKILP